VRSANRPPGVDVEASSRLRARPRRQLTAATRKATEGAKRLAGGEEKPATFRNCPATARFVSAAVCTRSTYLLASRIDNGLGPSISGRPGPLRRRAATPRRRVWRQRERTSAPSHLDRGANSARARRLRVRQLRVTNLRHGDLPTSEYPEHTPQFGTLGAFDRCTSVNWPAQTTGRFAPCFYSGRCGVAQPFRSCPRWPAGSRRPAGTAGTPRRRAWRRRRRSC